MLDAVSLTEVEKVIVITDQLPIQKKRKAIEKAVKHTLTEMLPADSRYQLLHHSSKSAFGLQVADYINWAVFRAWERGDLRSLDQVRHLFTGKISMAPFPLSAGQKGKKK